MLKVGFIGTGNFANQHATILANKLNVKIVGCYGTNEQKTLDFSKKFGAAIYHSPFDMISKNILDALYIVIPPFAHDGKVETYAIDQKIPFFCEKPIALDLNITRNIAFRIEQNNLLTSVGYLLRYEPLFRQIKNIIKRNNISTTRINSYSYMPQVHWWKNKLKSGGMMVEQGTHYVDILRYLFGEITFVSAISTEGLSKNVVDGCDIYDSMEAIMKFESGIIASIGVTHLLNKINARNDALEIYGEDFSLKIDLYSLRYKNKAKIIYKECGNEEWQITERETSKEQLMLEESKVFIQAILSGDNTSILSTYPDALKTLEVTLAMNTSSEKLAFIPINA